MFSALCLRTAKGILTHFGLSKNYSKSFKHFPRGRDNHLEINGNGKSLQRHAGNFLINNLILELNFNNQNSPGYAEWV